MNTHVLTLVLSTLLLSSAGAAELEKTSCFVCHTNADYFEAEEIEHVREFTDDVHNDVGLLCHDCHGGNPDLALAEDADAAMDPDGDSPYVGAPNRSDVPEFCGRCHSDPIFMKRFDPDGRVDQEAEYWTSRHGVALREGVTDVATCIDCHGVHSIRRAADPRSPVYPINVAETCRGCHEDAERMAGTDGRSHPIDQYSRWRQSVHAEALLDREDLSAPTCNDCHGNHGASPPGIESVSFVCGQCHGREASLFRASSKHDGFLEHNEYLADASGCAECHTEQVDPPALRTFTECTSCHGNHAVIRPTVALLGSLPNTPCAFCHELSGQDVVGEPETIWDHYVAERDRLLDEAAAAGFDGADRFDWLVDAALGLAPHTHSTREGSDAPPALRPEFERLFEKFRIGKTHYTYTDPVTGADVRAPVRRCDDCHVEEPDLAERAVGLSTARAFVDEMQRLTATTARAERILLRAQRGGVELHGGLDALDQAIDAQIELEVLVHTFSEADSGAFRRRHGEGVEHAQAALAVGHTGLMELEQRRRGLAVTLVVIVLVLIGLGAKIRQGAS